MSKIKAMAKVFAEARQKMVDDDRYECSLLIKEANGVITISMIEFEEDQAYKLKVMREIPKRDKKPKDWKDTEEQWFSKAIMGKTYGKLIDIFHTIMEMPLTERGVSLHNEIKDLDLLTATAGEIDYELNFYLTDGIRENTGFLSFGHPSSWLEHQWVAIGEKAAIGIHQDKNEVIIMEKKEFEEMHAKTIKGVVDTAHRLIGYFLETEALGRREKVKIHL